MCGLVDFSKVNLKALPTTLAGPKRPEIVLLLPRPVNRSVCSELTNATPSKSTMLYPTILAQHQELPCRSVAYEHPRGMWKGARMIGTQKTWQKDVDGLKL